MHFITFLNILFTESHCKVFPLWSWRRSCSASSSSSSSATRCASRSTSTTSGSNGWTKSSIFWDCNSKTHLYWSTSINWPIHFHAKNLCVSNYLFPSYLSKTELTECWKMGLPMKAVDTHTHTLCGPNPGLVRKVLKGYLIVFPSSWGPQRTRETRGAIQ